jgi:hypothetical protein
LAIEVIERPGSVSRSRAARTELTPPETPPALAAPVTRWLSARCQTSDRAKSVRHARDAFRYFLRWLAQAYPDVDAMTQMERRHIEGFMGPPPRPHQRPDRSVADGSVPLHLPQPVASVLP